MSIKVGDRVKLLAFSGYTDCMPELVGHEGIVERVGTVGAWIRTAERTVVWPLSKVEKLP